MTRFGAVMVTYFATMTIGVCRLRSSGAEADLERQRQCADRTVSRATSRRPALHRVGRGARRRAPLANFLAERGYLPKSVPLLKHILALPGQTVCRTGRTITVDAAAMGEALERDRRSRLLPVWQGCRVIARARSSS